MNCLTNQIDFSRHFNTAYLETEALLKALLKITLCIKYIIACTLHIIRQTPISSYYNHIILINIKQNVTKCGRITERHRASNLVELKFYLKLFRLSSYHFYSCRHIRDRKNNVFHCPETLPQFYTNLQSPNLEEYNTALRG